MVQYLPLMTPEWSPTFVRYPDAMIPSWWHVKSCNGRTWKCMVTRETVQWSKLRDSFQKLHRLEQKKYDGFRACLATLKIQRFDVAWLILKHTDQTPSIQGDDDADKYKWRKAESATQCCGELSSHRQQQVHRKIEKKKKHLDPTTVRTTIQTTM